MEKQRIADQMALQELIQQRFDKMEKEITEMMMLRFQSYLDQSQKP